jgi:hypothetical protein
MTSVQHLKKLRKSSMILFDGQSTERISHDFTVNSTMLLMVLLVLDAKTLKKANQLILEENFEEIPFCIFNS